MFANFVTEYEKKGKQPKKRGGCLMREKVLQFLFRVCFHHKLYETYHVKSGFITLSA
jgi:hypothetical protein